MRKIAVLSGKGGVGKSFVSAMLALGLSKKVKTGLLDADVSGPNIPLMFSVEGPVMVGENGKMAPVEKDGLKILSLGLMLPTGSPVLWRGILAGKAFAQSLEEAEWDVDLLVMDMPPGTGDVALTALQKGVDAAVVVITPQKVVLDDVNRTLTMLDKFGVPVIAVVENMSYVTCPNGDKVEPFGESKEQLFLEKEVNLFVKLPLDPSVSSLLDEGKAADAYELVKGKFEEIVAQVLSLNKV